MGAVINKPYSELTDDDIDIICESNLCAYCPLRNTKYCTEYYEPKLWEICKSGIDNEEVDDEKANDL